MVFQVEADFPVLLDQPRPHLRVYERATVVAEKLHGTVELGIANSRITKTLPAP